MAQVTVFETQQPGFFSTTSPLVLSSHPEDGEAWPAWAVLAAVHTLGEEGDDLFVTYYNTARTSTAPGDRQAINGVSIDVKRLFVWDWGPNEIAVDSLLFVSQQRDVEINVIRQVETI